MIERISGQLIKSMPTHAIVDVSGVGYGVEMPLSVIAELPAEGSDVTLWIHTHVREDTFKLYGFLEYADRLAFDVLLQLNGVGPKMALAMLSTLSVSVLCRAIELGSKEVLQQVPGVGARKAEKILVELKAKLPKLQVAIKPGALSTDQLDMAHDRLQSSEGLAGTQSGPIQDVKSALENLGFKDKQIEPVIRHLLASMPDAPFQELLRVSLRRLAKPLNDEAPSDAVTAVGLDQGRDSALY